MLHDSHLVKMNALMPARIHKPIILLSAKYGNDVTFFKHFVI